MGDDGGVIIRGYRGSDLGDLYDVCVRTADSGADARGSYVDADVLPAVFAGPYASLEPELTFVLDNGSRVIGYILGTADTPRFVRRFRAEWLPRVAERYPAPVGEPATADERIAGLLHQPERMLRPEFADYPAHLHIDLLPAAQRAGYGSRLMHTFLDALRARHVPAVHLEMATDNTGARAFYDRIGFHEIPVPSARGTTCLGLRLDGTENAG